MIKPSLTNNTYKIMFMENTFSILQGMGDNVEL
jgi:hypothetical protein